jgi:hypothetical protein
MRLLVNLYICRDIRDTFCIIIGLALILTVNNKMRANYRVCDNLKNNGTIYQSNGF